MSKPSEHWNIGTLTLEGKQGNILTFKKGKQAVGALTLEHSLHTNIDMALDIEIGNALLVGPLTSK